MMRSGRRASLVAAVVMAAGCGGGRRAPAPPAPGVAVLASATAIDGGAAPAAPVDASAPAPLAPPATAGTARGVPHMSPIVAAALARHGDAALSIFGARGDVLRATSRFVAERKN